VILHSNSWWSGTTSGSMTLCTADGTPLWSYDTQSFNPGFDYWAENGVVIVQVRDSSGNIVEQDAVQPSGATHPLVGYEYVEDAADNGWYVTNNWNTGESFLFNDQGDLVYQTNSDISLADNCFPDSRPKQLGSGDLLRTTSIKCGRRGHDQPLGRTGLQLQRRRIAVRQRLADRLELR